MLTTRRKAVIAAIALGIVATTAMLNAADEKPRVPSQRQESPKPKAGEKLENGIEKKLKWGEAVNGLRSALLIRPSRDEPKADDVPDLYLVVQNVSNAPIRLNDTAETTKLRELYLKRSGKTLLGMVIKEPAHGDVVLQPRAVAFVLMFQPDSKSSDGQKVGSVIAEGALKDTKQTLFAEMLIENAPAGAWTGKLVSGETTGAVAASKP